MKLMPGDIVEIERPGGLRYVQVTHDHPSYPEVVRSISGRYSERPQDLAMLARAESGFSAMVPLAAAIEKRKVKAERIGQAAVPATHAAFPTFRMPIRDRQGGVAYWWLWDGSGLSYRTELDEETVKHPLREVMTVDAFLDKLD